MGIDAFAEFFTQNSSLTALLYDNRCFGASDGAPRLEVNHMLQMADLQDAITFAQSIEEVDPGKIVLWGTSYSAATVLHVSALDRRTKAVLVQNPMVNGLESFNGLVSSVLVPQFLGMFEAGFTFLFNSSYH